MDYETILVSFGRVPGLRRIGCEIPGAAVLRTFTPLMYFALSGLDCEADI